MEKKIPLAIKIAKIVSVCLMLFAIALLIINPKAANNLPSGFKTPIIAIEFIQTKAAIIKFFEVANVEKYRSDLLLGNCIDYIFMFLYSGLIACIGVFIFKDTNIKKMYLIFICSILMIIGDAFENYQLYQLTIKLRDFPDIVQSINSFNFYEIHIVLLKLFTWLKWSTIAISFLIFAPTFLKSTQFFSKTIGIVCACSAILGVLAFLKHGILNELFAATVSIVFILLIVFVFKYQPEEIQA